MINKLEDDKGAALVTVVWSVLLLSILAAGILSLTLTSRKSTETLVEEKQQLYLAQSALDLFLARYFYDEEGLIFQEGTIEVLDANVNIRVIHEAGKINLNRADLAHLSLAFAANGVAEAKSLELASAIIDWRDRDDVPLVLGAESQEYLNLGLPVGPRNGPFESVGELQLVSGVTAELFTCISPLLTVYSLSGIVDYSLAGKQIRDALGWAFNHSWQGGDWPDPVLEEDVQSLESELGGKSLEIELSLGVDSSVIYSTIIRYRSTSDRSFRVLKPLAKKAQYIEINRCANLES